MKGFSSSIFTSLSQIEFGFISLNEDLVVASAGEDKKISLWRINGQFMGTIPIAGSDTRDKIEVNFPLV